MKNIVKNYKALVIAALLIMTAFYVIVAYGLGDDSATASLLRLIWLSGIFVLGLSKFVASIVLSMKNIKYSERAMNILGLQILFVYTAIFILAALGMSLFSLS